MPDLPTFVYRKLISSGRIGRRAWGLARAALIHCWGDPTCTLEVHGRRLQMPLSHPLPRYLADHPHYDRLPRRLGDFMRERQQRLVVIDVGANIGDTVAAFRRHAADRFLAIEPCPRYHAFLGRNWGGEANVVTIEEACCRAEGEGGFRAVEADGTASLVRATDGQSIRGRTLDAIVADHHIARDANVLKIDTDGHDFEVIAGATRLLSEQLPAVLFECAPFGNTGYVGQCLETLERLHGHGYRHILVYDNLGNLLGRHSLDNLAAFRDLLFFQVTSDRLYYDVLAMKENDVAAFHRREQEYFAAQARTTALQHAATAAAGC